jgi:hypothetical protein
MVVRAHLERRVVREVQVRLVAWAVWVARAVPVVWQTLVD